MAYKHVIRAKTKNLFDVNKITESTYLKNNKDGTITVSVYGVSGGLLKNLCPELKVGDVIKVYFQPLRWTAPNPPLVMVVGDVIFDRNGNSRLTVTEKSLNKPVLFYNNHYDERGLPGTTIIGNILITTDLTITNKNYNVRYTPYNYLQSNKRMIKVSDVCQLYAKNIWQEYTDLYGVSIKNNNDGSITLNGTATETFFYTNILDYEIKPNHKYLYFDYYPQTPSWDTYVGGCEGKVNHESAVLFAIYNLNNDGTIDPSSPNLPSNTLLNTFCMCYKGFTLNNVTIKPQLFDLTEMFGAGHEPATVAEFRQRFPNELYPYSPQCWLTSYKSAVVCKTKNLFDVNNAVVINYNSQQETIDATHYVKDGIVYSDWNNALTGTCVGIKGNWTLPAGTYTMSVKIAYNTKRNDKDKYRGGSIGFACILADGSITRYMQWHGYIIPGERYTYTAEIPAGCKNIMLYLGVSSDPDIYSLPAAYCELMVEQGSTATSYVPYQHL